MVAVESCLRRINSLKSQRRNWERIYSEMSKLVLAQYETGVDLQSDEGDKEVCEIATLACLELAAAHVEYITPPGQNWLSYTAQSVDAFDSTKQWCGNASKITLGKLAESNYYTAKHLAYIDRCAYGLGCTYSDLDAATGRLHFQHIPCGTYAIAENDKGEVDTLVRWYKASAAQLMERFGKNGKIKSESIQRSYDNENKRHEVEFRISQLVYPREFYDPRRMTLDATNRPIASVYILEAESAILEEGGYYEFPFSVLRYVKGDKAGYSYPPGWWVRRLLRRDNFLEDSLDSQCELALYPRHLTLANQVGEIDFRAGGKTIVSPEAAQLGFPREWASSGNYSIGLDRLEKVEKIIEAAYHKPMIQVISSVDRAMTATEVMARENEKILAFSPSFTQLAFDMNQEAVRIFNLLTRADAFPPMPPEMLTETEEGWYVMPPSIKFNSKIAISLEHMQAESTIKSLNICREYANVIPEIIRPFKGREIGKNIARSLNADESGLWTDEEMQAADEAEAQQKQQEMQLIEAKEAAAAAKDGAAAAKEMGVI